MLFFRREHIDWISAGCAAAGVHACNEGLRLTCDDGWKGGAVQENATVREQYIKPDALVAACAERRFRTHRLLII